MKYARYFFIIIGVMLIRPVLSNAQTYFVNTYADNDTKAITREIFLKKIDLARAAIVDSLIIGRHGYIWNKKPAQIEWNGRDILIDFIESGGYAKNSIVGHHTVHYSIVQSDTVMSILRSDSISSALLNYFEQYPEENSFRLGIMTEMGKRSIFPNGDYSIDGSLNFNRVRSINPDLPPGGIQRDGNFEILNRLGPNNTHNLFYSVSEDSRFWILRLSSTQRIMDSIMIENPGYASTIFAYHPVTDKIYVFHLNYETHGRFADRDKNYGDNWINSQALIYDPDTLRIVSSLAIPDFDSLNYPYLERGQADIVGDYIVYYFFDDEWMGKYYPAMLFIFDTRTNQATWLRVGWR